jgi:hypothetical protein
MALGSLGDTLAYFFSSSVMSFQTLTPSVGVLKTFASVIDEEAK